MELRFEKYEGLGNDFLVVDDREAAQRIDAALAIELCDRHRGVGADGVLITGVGDEGPFMRVWNADGSSPQMCGNGVRCVALHLLERGLVPDPRFTLATDAGPHGVEVHADGAVTVAMRAATLAPESLPLRAGAPWIEERIEVAGHAVSVTAVSMGNPHAVIFGQPEEHRGVIGSALERDARFPERVNVGFADRTPTGLRLAVWERGVGWTQACGTGACAAAVAAVETGRAPRDEALEVHLPGGALTITVGAPDAPVRMTGPARRVFSGAVTLRPPPG